MFLVQHAGWLGEGAQSHELFQKAVAAHFCDECGRITEDEKKWNRDRFGKT